MGSSCRELCGRSFDDVRRAELGSITAAFAGTALTLRQSPDAGISGVVYDCSILLAAYLAAHGRFDNVRVVELGCGAGAASIMAAKLGGSVVATDRSDASLALTAENAQRNGTAVETVKYAFGDAVPETIRAADVVLLADVCYNADAPALLRATLRSLKPGGFAVASIALPRSAICIYDATGSALPEQGYSGIR